MVRGEIKEVFKRKSNYKPEKMVGSQSQLKSFITVDSPEILASSFPEAVVRVVKEKATIPSQCLKILSDEASAKIISVTGENGAVNHGSV